MTSTGSGGRTRTPKDRTRTCCVANYTTPEWAAVSLAAAVVVPDSEPCCAQARDGGLASEQVHGVEEGEARGPALDRDVEQLHRGPHRLLRPEPERLDRRAQVERLRSPLAGLHVRDGGVE